MGSAPGASLKGPFAEPKPHTEPHAQTYRPLSLFLKEFAVHLAAARGCFPVDETQFITGLIRS